MSDASAPFVPVDHKTMPRRRFLKIMAGAVAFGCMRPAWALQPVRWQGRVMGADAEIVIHDMDKGRAERAIGRVLFEIGRLEGLFSLHDARSFIRRLNDEAGLPDAPADMQDILAVSREIHDKTHGAFDPTVQPLWRLYADHFAKADADPDGPNPEAIGEALSRTGLLHIAVTDGHIGFLKPGMALTLNGIAQGYITDKARDILRAEGLRHVLVNMGEYAAIGPRSDGESWTIGIADPLAPWRVVERVSLPADHALATSAGAGTAFDDSLRHHHLFDPRTGQSATHHGSVTVMAPDATLADALSTAFSVLPFHEIEAIMPSFPACTVFAIGHDGKISRCGSRT